MPGTLQFGKKVVESSKVVIVTSTIGAILVASLKGISKCVQKLSTVAKTPLE